MLGERYLPSMTSPLTIRQCSVSEMQATSDLDELLAEYATESANPDLGGHDAQYQTYAVMEQAGVLHIFCAYKGDRLVGFLVLICMVLPHFGRMVGSSESIFVSAPHRKTGAGLKLIAAAEAKCRELGAIGFYLSGPVGGALCQALSKAKAWRPTNQVFFKGLQDAA